MNPRLAEMLTTRLCHDLTGPIGAVSNGAEFLEEESEMQGEAIKLIVSSAQEAVHRLQFYRRAYGRVASSGEADLEQLRQLISELLQSAPITLEWGSESMDVGKVSLGQKMGRVLLNLIIIASGSLLRGGSLIVDLGCGESEGGESVIIRATGAAIKLDDEIVDVLKSGVDDEDLTPKNVQAAFLYKITSDIDAVIAVEKQEDALILTVRKVK